MNDLTADNRIPAIGDVAPDFQAADSAGTVRSLSSLAAGSRVVLVFYRGHW